MPSWKVIGSVVALGVVGLGVAYVLYFALITGAGASRAILVTYLVPPMALVLRRDHPRRVRVRERPGRAGADPARRLARRRRRPGRFRRRRRPGRRRDPPLPADGRAALAAIWGASYLFIKVGVRDFQPPTLMALRLVIAFVPLFVYLAVTRGGAGAAARQVASVWRTGLVLGLLSAAIPFTLVAWGEKHIDSGVAGVAQASLPVFTALLALRFMPSERATGAKVVGIAFGLAGVAVLTGIDPGTGWWAVAGTVAVVLSSLAYSAGGLFGQTRTETVPGAVLATATVFYGALVLLPWGSRTCPRTRPAGSRSPRSLRSRSPEPRSRSCSSSTSCACTARPRWRS